VPAAKCVCMWINVLHVGAQGKGIISVLALFSQHIDHEPCRSYMLF